MAEANDLQARMMNQSRADNGPWRQAGANALMEIEKNKDYYNHNFGMQDFQKDPGYDFRLAEGMKALERSAAARGSLNSGATMKALTQYGQNFASNEFGNAFNRYNTEKSNSFNRLAALAGIGQNANNSNTAVGQNYANQTGQNLMDYGNVKAAEHIGQANAINSAIGTGANTWMQYQMMNRLFPQGGK